MIIYRIALWLSLVLMAVGCTFGDYFIIDTSQIINNEGTPIAAPPTPIVTTVPATCQIRTDWYPYTVVRGDTLGNIASRFGTTVNALAQANCIANINNIIVGQPLRVPQQAPNQPQNPAPRINSFRVIAAGSNQAIEWSTTGIANVRINGRGPNGENLGDFNNLPANGTQAIPAFGPEYTPQVTYYLFALDASGRDVRDPNQPNEVLGSTLQIPVNGGIVHPNLQGTLNASPDPVTQGGTVTLSWNIPNYSTVAVSRAASGQAGWELVKTDLPASGSLTTVLPMAYTTAVQYIVHPNTAEVTDTLASVVVTIQVAQTTLACPAVRGNSVGGLTLIPDNRRSDACSVANAGQALTIAYPYVPDTADLVRFAFVPISGVGCPASSIEIGVDAIVYDGASVTWTAPYTTCAGLISALAQYGSGIIENREMPLVIQ